MSLPQPPVVTTCYRHPDREAGRRCTRCGRPACSECLVQASVGSHCIDCARAARPDVKTRAKYWSAGQHSLVTYVLIALNVAVFAWLVANDSHAFSDTRLTEGQFRLGLSKLVLQRPFTFSATDPYTSHAHEWYRLLTSGFIHFGIIHIAFNMWALYVIGQFLERLLGRVRFSLLYFAGLFGGSLGVLIQGKPNIAGGASGAVFALMGAAVVALWRQGINPLQTSLGRVFLLNLVITFVFSNFISIGAHIGGAIVGAVLGMVMLAPKWKPIPKWATYAAPIVALVGSIIASVAIVGT